MALPMTAVVAGMLLPLVACAPRPALAPVEGAGRAANPTAAREGSPTPVVRESITTRAIRARPELGKAFEEEHVEGGIALFDSATGELTASDPELAKRPFSPASTFKIAHTAIALELGVLDNPDSPMPWDGQYSSNEEWNRDHTLRTATQVSCVPCFQHVARSIGPERMQEWLERFDYGNHDASGAIERFWLDGGGKLRITAIEQLDFLRRLDTGKLPISTRTLDIARDVIALDVGLSHVFYGITGLSGSPERAPFVAWFVGFVALEKRSVYFATLITGHAPNVDVRPQRRRVTERILRSLGVLPGADGTAQNDLGS